MACLCLADEGDFQPWPKTGRLAANPDLYLADLDKLLPEIDNTPVYSYVIQTIQRRGNGFAQTGSGPNFQGGLITLCTCKHLMRTSLDVASWVGVWVAGFSGVKVTDRGNGLVYLMRVSEAFESHYDLWEFLCSEVRQAKAAHLHTLGDVFKPKPDHIYPDDPGRFKPGNYEPPRKDHSHASIERNSNAPRWYRDVNYRGYGGRRAALLVGDPKTSFLWSEPKIFFAGRQHPRTKRWESPQEFLEHLIDKGGLPTDENGTG
jgi:hypothetical protein